MNLDRVLSRFNTIQNDKSANNFIAQSDSRKVLLETGEPISSFPNYTEDLDNRLNSIAFSYLATGCQLVDKEMFEESIIAFSKAATVIENAYSSNRSNGPFRTYFLLISALAHYCSFQYSRAYILLTAIEQKTIVSKLISQFLKKDLNGLLYSINEVLLGTEHSENAIIASETSEDADILLYNVLLSKAMVLLLEFLLEGDKKFFEKAKDAIQDLIELASINCEPAVWWIFKLLYISITGLFNNSMWTLIPPLIPGAKSDIVNLYIRSLAFKKSPITELFVSQKAALPLISKGNGAILSLPTSAGKTRIAEISIMKILAENPEALILYLAPFRSLAMEVETALEEVLTPCGFHITHLYGGGHFSQVDRVLLKDANVVIATPEKAKAILRIDKAALNRIKLCVVDEGHLLGFSRRYISNEMFLEELRYWINSQGGKFLLLSAVLPNASELAQWLSNDKDAFINSNWRPAAQRLGVLSWTGSNANISWRGEISSFNRNFLEPFQVFKPRSSYVYPKNKKQAIALTAFKLSSQGTVLIYVGRAKMVKSQARELVVAMHYSKYEHSWTCLPELRRFQLACEECYGPNSELFTFAKCGIICHSADLPSDLRISMERLMRKGNPRIVICTSTLGQGVNFGISTVIFANVWITDKKTITINDFWNIAGRAGRAFTDSEGKILYVIDETVLKWQKDRDQLLLAQYFDSVTLNRAQSGIYLFCKELMKIASKCNLSFDNLLELVSNNNLSAFKHESGQSFEPFLTEMFDCIDDTLLSLNIAFESHNHEDHSYWIDDYFRTSLSYLQAAAEPSFAEDSLLQILKARNNAVLKISGPSENWLAYVQTGIPLSSSIVVKNNLVKIIEISQSYLNSSKTTEDLTTFLTETEIIIQEFPSVHFKHEFDGNDIDNIRKLWISGAPVGEIIPISDDTNDILSEYFGFTLPWAINAIAKTLNILGNEEVANAFEELALLTELGLPTSFASKLYLCGLRSRVAATELSKILKQELADISRRKLHKLILANIDNIMQHCSKFTCDWIKALLESPENDKLAIKSIPGFKVNWKSFSSDSLRVRKLRNSLYLCSPDYGELTEISSSPAVPLDLIANDLGITYEYDKGGSMWSMRIRNPLLELKENV
jgi:hypothetical protein